jgi:hypothetical protein
LPPENGPLNVPSWPGHMGNRPMNQLDRATVDDRDRGNQIRDLVQHVVLRTIGAPVPDLAPNFGILARSP